MRMNRAISSYLPALLLTGIVACSNTPEEPMIGEDLPEMVIDEDLLDVVWAVDSLQTPDTTVVIASEEHVTIQFTTDQRIRGSSGCRPMEGKYLIGRAGKITISDLIVDPREYYCGARLEYLAGELSQTLEHITSYDLDGNRLTLYEISNLYLIYLTSE